MSFNQSINQSINQPVSMSVNQSVSISVNQSVCLSVSKSVSQSVSQSISQSVSMSVSQSVCQSINLPVFGIALLLRLLSRLSHCVSSASYQSSNAFSNVTACLFLPEVAVFVGCLYIRMDNLLVLFVQYQRALSVRTLYSVCTACASPGLLQHMAP